ncbi:heme-binding protein [Thioclava sp. FTW29]|uniref:Heme-binding protein n=1 Tax=Thioclava litoralis TaxID=3076557 RepID=A0ABZ1E285_9RHOB|nr:heme-binding protein [Thioclava sp. FTW29]
MTQTQIVTSADISVSAAQALVQKGVDQALKAQKNLSFAVVDRAGYLVAFARMDGAALVTVDVAIGKAHAAAFLKGPSKGFEDMINSGSPSMATVPNVLPLQGGMPILYNGQIVGAIGVSGSSGDDDQATAAALAGSFQP